MGSGGIATGRKDGCLYVCCFPHRLRVHGAPDHEKKHCPSGVFQATTVCAKEVVAGTATAAGLEVARKFTT